MKWRSCSTPSRIDEAKTDVRWNLRGRKSQEKSSQHVFTTTWRSGATRREKDANFSGVNVNQIWRKSKKNFKMHPFSCDDCQIIHLLWLFLLNFWSQHEILSMISLFLRLRAMFNPFRTVITNRNKIYECPKTDADLQVMSWNLLERILTQRAR